MLKKIIIGVLLISVIGAAGAAFAYNAINQDADTSTTGPSPLANGASSSISEESETDQAQNGPVAEGLQGEAWEASGTIAAIDENGFDFTLDSGETVYVELGPTDYWQSQGIELAAGQTATIVGSINEDMMIHATQVELADDQVLALRTETGQPLWSGGASNGQGQNGQNSGQADGDHSPEPKADVDDWITLEGTLMSFQGGNMTMSTADGALISFKTGQPRFFADQGITFQVGDEISVLGFYEGEQFSAGEITQLATDLRVMLRDPNGRPLWAGPGNSSGNGNGGNGNGGNGNGGNSQGNGGQQ